MTLTTEHPSLRERQHDNEPPVASRLMIQALREIQQEAPQETRALAPVEHRVEGRPRNARGHCLDGQVCDHPDHGSTDPADGIVHFIL